MKGTRFDETYRKLCNAPVVEVPSAAQEHMRMFLDGTLKEKHDALVRVLQMHHMNEDFRLSRLAHSIAASLMKEMFKELNNGITYTH